METLYWIAEYAKVLLAYLFLMFAFPSILFHRYLRDKDWAFWFGFCVSTQIMLVSTVVLMLGLVGLLNAWVVRGLFYGSILVVFFRSRGNRMTARYVTYKLQNRTYGMRLFFSDIRSELFGNIRGFFRYLWGRIRPNFLEFSVLMLLVIYGMTYFGWGSVREHIFGASDVPVHHQWTYGLIQGQAFSRGIYPEAMHCFAYAIHTLFGIRTFNVLLYLEPVHIIAVLVAIYCMLNEIFNWKYTGLMALAAFLTLKAFSVTEVTSTARMQWSLPQEFGLYSVFIIPTFLVRYLKNGKRIEGKKGLGRFLWSEDLIVFSLAIAASISSHFYVTIMAIFTCAAVVIVWLFRIFHWRRLVPLMLSAFLALFLSVSPMVLAFAEGIPLQGSLYWALGIMGITREEEEAPAEEEPEEEEEEAEKETVDPEFEALRAAAIARAMEDAQRGELGNFYYSSEDAAHQQEAEAEEEPSSESMGLRQRLRARLVNWYVHFTRTIDQYGYSKFFTSEWSPVLQLLTVAAIAVCILYRILAVLLKYVFRRSWVKTDLLDGYAMAAMYAFVYILELSAPYNGMPKVIETERIVTISKIGMIYLVLFPVDVIGSILTCWKPKGAFSQLLAAAGTVGVIAAVVLSDNFHGFLHFNMQRMPATVDVTNSIISTIPKQQFTIVSTTDELYQLIEYGFHEELLTFMRRFDDKEYYLPTPYVFFFAEKKALYPNHFHFPSGPAWLARDLYSGMFAGMTSKCPDIKTNEIDEESISGSLNLGSKLSAAYHSAANRVIVEANAQAYSKLLMERYPNHCTVYYEDDYMIVYCLEQNPDRLYNLSRNAE